MRKIFQVSAAVSALVIAGIFIGTLAQAELNPQPLPPGQNTRSKHRQRAGTGPRVENRQEAKIRAGTGSLHQGQMNTN